MKNRQKRTSRIVNTGKVSRRYNRREHKIFSVQACKTKAHDPERIAGRKGFVMSPKHDMTSKIIGANIRRLRLLNGDTQQELGHVTGYGASTIANYESGYRMPDLETLIVIANHYNTALDEFIIDNTLGNDKSGIQKQKDEKGE